MGEVSSGPWGGSARPNRQMRQINLGIRIRSARGRAYTSHEATWVIPYDDIGLEGSSDTLSDTLGACVGAVLTWFLTAKPLQCRIAHEFGPHLTV